MPTRYNSYSDYFKKLFGQRVQKLSIDAGFCCPNRDGTLGVGGCTFCNNDAFTPSYCRTADSALPLTVSTLRTPDKSIAQQIQEGIDFHAWRYRKSTQYLAYFQSYSNTYAPLDILRQRYSEALQHPQVIGIVIGTRPDCIDEDKLALLSQLAQTHFVAVEYGVESCYDDTLLRVHRGHDFATSRRAIEATSRHRIHCGAHFVLGFPGDSRERLLQQASIINTLPLNTVKFHQLQILKGSLMEQEYTLWKNEGKTSSQIGDGFYPFSLEEYVGLMCDILERLRPDLVIERFAGEVPPRYQAAPERSWRRPDGSWLRNEDIPNLIENELRRRSSYQGSRFAH